MKIPGEEEREEWGRKKEKEKKQRRTKKNKWLRKEFTTRGKPNTIEQKLNLHDIIKLFQPLMRLLCVLYYTRIMNPHSTNLDMAF